MYYRTMERMSVIPHKSGFRAGRLGTLLIAWIVLFAPTQRNNFGFSLGASASNAQSIRVLVLGDSLSAGYGLDPEQAFPALLEERARRSGLPVEVVNAGVSGDTTASGLRRINWLLRSPVDVLLLELGANDGLRGVSPETTYRNLQEIVDRARTSKPAIEIILAGMMVPPNMGADYSRKFRAVFPTLAAEKDLHLIPFLLEGVAGNPSLNLPDGIHPNSAGHRILADNVWKVLGPILQKIAATGVAGTSGLSR